MLSGLLEGFMDAVRLDQEGDDVVFGAGTIMSGERKRVELE